MDKKAKKIWQAWLDGKKVQCLCDVWMDGNPSLAKASLKPEKVPELWRIKPEVEYRIYRVWLSKNNELNILDIKSNSDANFYIDQIKNRDDFSKWVSDWIEYFIYIEEENEDKDENLFHWLGDEQAIIRYSPGTWSSKNSNVDLCFSAEASGLVSSNFSTIEEALNDLKRALEF